MAELSDAADGVGGESLASVEEIHDAAGARVLKVSGEVDLSSVGALRAAVADTVGDHPGEIVFDLSDVAFMDSSGIAFLLTVGGDHQVEIRDASEVVRRVIELSGLAATLRVES